MLSKNVALDWYSGVAAYFLRGINRYRIAMPHPKRVGLFAVKNYLHRGYDMFFELMRREFLRLKPMLAEFLENLPYYIIKFMLAFCTIFGAICFVGFVYAKIIGRI